MPEYFPFKEILIIYLCMEILAFISYFDVRSSNSWLYILMKSNNFLMVIITNFIALFIILNNINKLMLTSFLEGDNFLEFKPSTRITPFIHMPIPYMEKLNKIFFTHLTVLNNTWSYTCTKFYVRKKIKLFST